MGISVPLFTLVSLLALYFGYSIRDEYFLTPESGLGYALGIIGGSFMLLLLLYPLRKRVVFGSRLISLRRWFQIHMILGVVGPICVLYHCNFSLGSTNSNVALVSMIVMALSGLVGRFLYTRIHFGLYGHKVTLNELSTRMLRASRLISDHRSEDQLLVNPLIFEKLDAYQRLALEPRGFCGDLLRVVSLWFKTRYLYWVLRLQLVSDKKRSLAQSRLSRKEINQCFRQVRDHIAVYLAIIRKTANFGFYEQLFSLWHLFHLPIFFMLIATGLVHVYVVHLY